IRLDYPRYDRHSRPTLRVVTPQRKPRALKVYKNPHSGEVVETKGGNHGVLKAWKQEYGAETVESWLQS
ncbi:histone-like nucleoid-structuring protein, MvaT/MvaU family, partial [Pseudomonas aeruginosa]